MNAIQTVCVYAASADRLAEDYLQAACALGELLAQQALTLVFGAGKTGLMGAVADAALAAGGQVIGVTPVHLNTPALIHSSLTRLEVVDSIHLRKARMSELADAFIALPGGFGTFEELLEMLTWAQIGLHNKPIGLLNTRRYYDPLLALIRHAGAEGFILPEHEHLLLANEDPTLLLESLRGFMRPDGLERWLDRDGAAGSLRQG